MNYTIVQVSGKQLLMKPGQWYDLDFIKNGINGNYISLKKILLIKKENKIQLGMPFLLNTELPVKILQTIKGKKLIILKTKPKKNYTKIRGHKQIYTRVKIENI
jgi:large subunit ribosomal protein L21